MALLAFSLFFIAPSGMPGAVKKEICSRPNSSTKSSYFVSSCSCWGLVGLVGLVQLDVWFLLESPLAFPSYRGSKDIDSFEVTKKRTCVVVQ